MDFDIEKFKKRLRLEQGMSDNAALFIQQEVRKAEDMKAGLSEETGEATPFVSEAINRIDTYIFQLHELGKDFNIRDYALDQRTYFKDEEIHERIGERLERLKERGEANAPTEDPMLFNGSTNND